MCASHHWQSLLLAIIEDLLIAGTATNLISLLHSCLRKLVHVVIVDYVVTSCLLQRWDRIAYMVRKSGRLPLKCR
ncbi:hypothetical protein V8B97DRAFT_1941580 [Scleroderma yunnanense]